VENTGKGNAIRELWLDGARYAGEWLELADDGNRHSVRVVLG
jgi:hypothetical protein